MYRLFFISFCFHAITAFAQGDLQAYERYHNPFYLGASGGYGSTTWEGLVPSDKNKNIALNISTPILVGEGGAVWGGFVGFEFSPHFALELSYLRYPTAKVTFDPDSLYAFENDGQQSFHTKTDTLSFMAKLMLFIPHTALRVYSSIGPAGIHRRDSITNQWRIAPAFGVGINYNVTEHFMAELAGNFTAGYGESELNPALDYIPFLYSGLFRLAYRF